MKSTNKTTKKNENEQYKCLAGAGPQAERDGECRMGERRDDGAGDARDTGTAEVLVLGGILLAEKPQLPRRPATGYPEHRVSARGDGREERISASRSR